MRHTTRRSQQAQSSSLSPCSCLFLLGFIGLPLDFGRLFIVKTEMQTAMDSCALRRPRSLTEAAMR